jgi:ABC-type transport system involved in multi-copper enzyme maturation permease subunit
VSTSEIAQLPWSLWRRQIAAVLRLELKKSFLSRRGLWIYLLAMGPLLLTAGHSLHVMSTGRQFCSIAEDSMAFATIFQLFYLKFGIFFGCVAVFTNLFRGEVLERTLHYYFLAPVRREVLLVGKYLSGLTAATVLFTASAGIAYLTISMHFGQEYWKYIFNGPGGAQLLWYMAIAALACVGYGSIFLMMGLVYRNPMVPAAVIMVWEGINGFLPPLLKKFSIIFYLKSLCPVDVPLPGALALLALEADPVPAWLAIPGLLAVSLGILYLAARRIRRFQISYSE